WSKNAACHASDHFLLVTQNIDNLHERAGNRRVIHMHGELLKVRCSWSGQVLGSGTVSRTELHVHNAELKTQSEVTELTEEKNRAEISLANGERWQ
ncbi:Sir2 family NAD-dependent protein deacetylase, partial [Klebsiella pneumoniae]|uniref:Sir2 family NAD-dependent protein deacetylase n=1 Tax=Klebsiella pneumoniae TaxID=573 RepID=UPI00272E235E